ncbi:hypothetical protein Tco_0862802 [Tanacetum coccineum]
MIRANINSNEGNKSEFYYQLGIGLYRIGDGKGAKKALEDCLTLRKMKIDRTLWEARNLLENVKLLLDGNEANTRSKSTLLKYVIVACGLALGVTCTMIVSWENLNERHCIQTKMISTCADGNKAVLGTTSVVASIVGAAFLIGLKKSSSG